MKNLYDRYIRHLVLSDIGLIGQDLLFKSKVLCIGAGGLGSPVLTYLASSGIGFIGIVEFDNVDLSNLNRQFLYKTSDINKLKSSAAASFLKKLNPNINIHVHNTSLSCDNFIDVMLGYDLIIECTDNFNSKFLISDSAIALDIPVVHGSVFGFSGYVSTFSRNHGCYRCLYKSFSYINCAGHGILGSVAGVIGAIQATEAIKYILSKNSISFKNLFSKLLVIDLKNLTFLLLDFNKDKVCSYCC